MLTYRAHAKINWALNITGRRPDGYHLLDMLMQGIELCDELRLEAAEGLSLRVNGEPAGEENLVLKAARALNRRTGRDLGARLALTKRVPERAGLGGGSADCAAALRGLNALWDLGLSERELLDIGETLGADVPFCLTGGLARVSGIGEVIEPVEPAPELPLVLLRPGDGLSTGAVFSLWDGLSTGAVFSLWDGGGFPEVALDTRALAGALSRRDLAAVDRLCANALAAPAIALMPGIGAAIGKMRSLGAAAAFMTGSGSAVVGAFEDSAAARRAAEALPGAILTRTLSRRED